MPFTLPSKFRPIVGFAEDRTYTVRERQFDDGYRQVAPQNINSIRATIPVKFICQSLADAQELMGYFDTAKGADPVNYTPPWSSETVRWLVGQARITYLSATKYEVNTTFTRFYG